MSAGTPEGWYFEGPDYEVGIFGSGWVHEDCPQEDSRVTDEEIAVRKEGVTRIGTVRLTCECGATVEVESYDYDPDEMPVEAFREEESFVEAER